MCSLCMIKYDYLHIFRPFNVIASPPINLLIPNLTYNMITMQQSHLKLNGKCDEFIELNRLWTQSAFE